MFRIMSKQRWTPYSKYIGMNLLVIFWHFSLDRFEENLFKIHFLLQDEVERVCNLLKEAAKTLRKDQDKLRVVPLYGVYFANKPVKLI